jgi:predicted negative regulator of RcsB-dependent stress response
VDRKTRKSLKQDQFAEEMKHGFDFLSHHTDEAKKYGAIAAGVIVIAAAVFFFMRYQADQREKALSEAIKVENAHVGPAPPGILTYPTQEEKDKARIKTFTDLATKYHGSQEGAIAEFYLASDAMDKGKLDEALKRFQDVMDSAPSTYASLAKLAVAKAYAAEGKDADAEKLLRDLIAHPTISVSKDQATIELALVVGKTNKDEARKMLEGLRTERTAISRAAVQALGEVAGAGQ